MDKPKRIVLSQEGKNSHGFKVLASGWKNKEAFFANPVMLYNHDDKILPIGYWEDIQVADGVISALPVFDMDDKFAAKIAKKYEKGFIRGASISLRILEVDETQDVPVVTAWEMRESSIAPIPSNSGCLVILYDKDDKKVINLADFMGQHHKTKSKMDFKLIGAELGLSVSATPAQVQQAIVDLKLKAASADSLQAKLDGIEKKAEEDRKERTTVMLNDAIKDGRITEGQRENYASLMDKDFDAAVGVLTSLPKRINLSDIAGATTTGKDTATHAGKTFTELSKEDPAYLVKLKDENFEAFNLLYKADLGVDYVR